MIKVNIKKLPESQIEIEGELSYEEIEKFKKKALDNLSKDVKIDGFRKGHIPENILEERIGAPKILERMSQFALEEAYPKILKDNKIDALGKPEVLITKLADKNPLGFKIKTAIMPSIKLPDYRKISGEEMAKPLEKVSVSQKEIDDTLNQMRQEVVSSSKSRGDKPPDPKNGAQNLPPLDDNFAKSLGDFKGLSDLKEKIKAGIEREKEYRVRDKKRIKILEDIAEKSEIEIPDVLIEHELNKMILELKASLEQSGLNFDDYLKHLEKTKDEFKKSWEKDAKKRVEGGLILHEIAKKENLKTDQGQVEKQVENILKYNKGADPEKMKRYIEGLLENEEVYKILESRE